MWIVEAILYRTYMIYIFFYLDGMDTEEGAKQKNIAMARKKFNMDPKKVKSHK